MGVTLGGGTRKELGSMAYRRGDVVLVPFPFRDRTAARVRPAVLVSGQQYHNNLSDALVAAITTYPPRFSTDYQLAQWRDLGLAAPPSFACRALSLHGVVYNSRRVG